jgi:hypothetical protein
MTAKMEQYEESIMIFVGEILFKISYLEDRGERMTAL